MKPKLCIWLGPNCFYLFKTTCGMGSPFPGHLWRFCPFCGNKMTLVKPKKPAKETT